MLGLIKMTSHVTKMWILLIGLYWILWAPMTSYAALTTSSTSSDGDLEDSTHKIDCTLDDDRSHPMLEQCLTQGNMFIRRYVAALREVGSGNPHTCREFQEFDDCIRPLMEQCHSIASSLHHWRPFIHEMRCYCQQNATCVESVTCFEQEYRGPLSSRCQAMYKFNVEQKTRDKCHFLREKIKCTQALVESSCGDRAGEFTFHTLKLYLMKQIERKDCYIIHRDEYHGFRYSEHCPNTFLTEMDTCLQQHLAQENMLQFAEDNDLVTLDSPKDVKRACRDFKKYKQCLTPIRRKCKQGTRLILEYMDVLRRNYMKMDYICDNKEVYMNSLKCYQDLIANDSLMQCNGIWSKLHPHLINMTSHAFYCQPESEASSKLRVDLEWLVRCYKTVTNETCGEDSAEVFAGITSQALSDPFYLKFTYLPDCKLHAPKPRQQHSQMGDSTYQDQASPPKDADKPRPTAKDPPKNNPLNQGGKPVNSNCALLKVTSLSHMMTLSTLALLSTVLRR